MNIKNIKVGNYIKIFPDKCYIAKINGFVIDQIRIEDSTIQITAVYPKSPVFKNISLSYETLTKFNASDVTWTKSENLMKLIY